MAVTITIFADTFQKIDDALMTMLGGKTAEIINIVSPVIMSAFLLYVLLVTMSYMKNGTDLTEIGGDLIQRFIGWAVIIGLSMNISNYNEIVVPMVTKIPEELTQIITGGNGSGITNSLDNLITMYANKIIDGIDQTSTFDVGGTILAIFVAILLLIFGLPAIAIAGGWILLAKVTTAILLVIAPVFLALALFPTTRNYASLWVAQAVNYGLLLLIVTVISAFQITIISSILEGQDLTISSAISVSSISALFIVVLINAPQIASALSGGMVLNGYTQAGKSVSGGVNAASGVAGRGLAGGKSVVGAIKGRLGGGANNIKPESAGK